MTLFRELFNKSGQTYRITVGEAFSSRERLAHFENDLEALTEGLRQFVAEAMPRGERRFQPLRPDAVDRDGQR